MSSWRQEGYGHMHVNLFAFNREKKMPFSLPSKQTRFLERTIS